MDSTTNSNTAKTETSTGDASRIAKTQGLIKPFTIDPARGEKLLKEETPTVNENNAYPEISGKAIAREEGTEAQENSLALPEIPAVPYTSGNETDKGCPYLDSSQNPEKPFTYDPARAKILLKEETPTVNKDKDEAEVQGVRKPFCFEIRNLEDVKRIAPYLPDIPKKHNPEATQTLQVAKPVQYVLAQEFSLGNYSFDGRTLRYLDANAKLQIDICNFWFELIAEETHIEEVANEQNEVIDANETVVWRVNIICGARSFPVVFTVSDFNNGNFLSKKTNGRAVFEEGPHVKKLYRQYINLLLAQGNLNKKIFYPSTGWRFIDGRYRYITDLGVIGAPNDKFFADVKYRFLFDQGKVGFKEIFDQFWHLRDLCPTKPENTVFLMHYACIATMTTLFQAAGHGINFLVALIGSTNSQKTEIGKIFTRMYDRTRNSKPDARFDSTLAAIREKMSTYGDSVLMVDDFIPYNDRTAASNQAKTLEALIRGYGDRTPRFRSKAYAKINNVSEFEPIMGCCLITGEVITFNSESSATRVMQLPFERGDVNLELLTFYQENILNIPTFLYDYISFVGDNIDLLFRLIQQEFSVIRSSKHPFIRTPRYVDTLALMSVEIGMFYEYAIAREFMDTETAKECRSIDCGYIEKIIMQNETFTKTQSVAAILFAALQQAIEGGKILVVSYEDAKNMADFKNVAVNLEQYLCILPDTLWELYCYHCRTLGYDLTYKNGRELAAPLKKEGALLEKEEGKSQRGTHKLNAKTSKRFFFIKKEVFRKLCDVFTKF